MTFICEHWEAISSLFLSIVAISIAIWSSRQTSKEATRQIESIKELTRQSIENTNEEVEHIKDLAKLQIETTLAEMDMEMSKHSILMQRADEERKAMNDINRSSSIQFQEFARNSFETERPLRDMKYTHAYLSELRRIANKMNEIKSKLN